MILPVPSAPDAPPVVRGLLGRALGAVAVLSLLLAGDSEQKTSLDVDLEKRARACLQKSGSAPSDAPTYWGLDDEGRATGAEACLGKDAHQVDNRPLRLRWDTGGYEFGMEAAHLIARQFGGLSIAENGVWAWPSVNGDMRVTERIVRNRLDLGERAYYFVKPIYRPGQARPIELFAYVRTSSGFEYPRRTDNIP